MIERFVFSRVASYTGIFAVWHRIDNSSQSPRMNDLNIPILTFQDLWLSSEAVDAHTQKVNALEASHYLYPVDMKSVLTNGALRNIVCRNF